MSTTADFIDIFTPGDPLEQSPAPSQWRGREMRAARTLIQFTAEAHFKKGFFAEAAACFDQIRNQPGTNLVIKDMAAQAHFNAGNTAKAAKIWNRM